MFPGEVQPLKASFRTLSRERLGDRLTTCPCKNKTNLLRNLKIGLGSDRKYWIKDTANGNKDTLLEPGMYDRCGSLEPLKLF